MKFLKTPLAGLCLLLVTFSSCKKEIIEQTSPEISTDETTVTATAVTTKYIKAQMFGGANPYSVAEWNKWNLNTSFSSSAFKYTDGTTSAISAVLAGQNGISDNGTTLNFTMAPKEAIRYASYSTSNRTLTFSGLDNAKTYDLEVYAARTGTSNNTTRFNIGTVNIDVKTDNNLSNKATFTSLVPVSGKIVLNITKLNTYTYINGFTLTEKGTDGAVVVPPPTEPVVTAPGCNSLAAKVYTLTKSGNEIWIPNASTRGWKGGDTLRIPAGSYDLIDLGNFKGDSCRPIVIINYGGQVVTKLIRFGNNAAYFKFTGTGHPGYTYGFKVQGTATGVGIGLAHHVEISNVEVTGTEVGFYFKKNPTTTDLMTVYPNYTLSNYYIHHNYIHDVHGEGMYIGDTYPNADPYNGNLTPIRMDKIEIAYNIVDGTDWDGIQLSNARSGAKIHHNTVTNFGRINMGSQQAGIILGGNTNGDVYDNVIRTGTGSGIQIFGYGTIKVYNNQVENTGANGTASGQESIYCNDPINLVETNPKQQIFLYNNTIKNPLPKGAVRVGAYNFNSLPSSLTNNTVYLPNAASNWLTFHMVTHVAGSTISGNTVIR
jgi:hypothetical protein